MNIASYAEAAVVSLDRLLGKRSVRAKLSKVVRGPRTLTIDIRLADPDEHPKALAVADSLALAVGADEVVSRRHLGVVRYEVQLPEHAWQSFGIGFLKSTMAIGVSSDRKEASFSLGRPTTLVIGESGSGKSNLVHVMMTQAMRSMSPDSLRIGLVDPHGGFAAFSGKAHLAGPPAAGRSEIADVFGWFRGELEKRKEMGEYRVATEGLPLLWLVADECSSADVLGEKGVSNERNLEVMRSLVKEGRKFGLRSLIITQKPTEADLPGILSISTNRYLGRLSKAVGQGLSNADGVSPHYLTGKGDFLHVSPVETVRFQAAEVRSQDYTSLPPGSYDEWPPCGDEDVFEPSPGRPRVEIEPEILAQYMTGKVTRSMAREGFGLGQIVHDRYKDFAARLSRAMRYER